MITDDSEWRRLVIITAAGGMVYSITCSRRNILMSRHHDTGCGGTTTHQWCWRFGIRFFDDLLVTAGSADRAVLQWHGSSRWCLAIISISLDLFLGVHWISQTFCSWRLSIYVADKIVSPNAKPRLVDMTSIVVDCVLLIILDPWWLDSLAWQLGHLVAHGHVLFGYLVACILYSWYGCWRLAFYILRDHQRMKKRMPLTTTFISLYIMVC